MSTVLGCMGRMSKGLGMTSYAKVRRFFLYALIAIKLLVMDGIED